MTLVKNLKGTSDKTCKCSSWLQHWKNNSGGTKLPTYCIESTCRETTLLGGHVIKVNSTDKNHYIIPICAKHNSTDSEYSVADGYFVSANKSETCDK
jgi:hypothetical protein